MLEENVHSKRIRVVEEFKILQLFAISTNSDNFGIIWFLGIEWHTIYR